LSKLSSPKWPSSSPKMVFVEIIFAEMAFVKSENGIHQKLSSSSPEVAFVETLFAEMVFSKSKNCLRRNGLHQVRKRSSSKIPSLKWSSSNPKIIFDEFFFAEMDFVQAPAAKIKEYSISNGCFRRTFACIIVTLIEAQPSLGFGFGSHQAFVLHFCCTSVAHFWVSVFMIATRALFSYKPD